MSHDKPGAAADREQTATLPVPDFRTFFETAPGAVLVLLPDDPVFTIVAASDAYVRISGVRREDLIGRAAVGIFPDYPGQSAASGFRSVRASLQNAIATRASHKLPTSRSNVQRSAAEGGGFEERYWSLLNTPVLGPDGRVQYLIHSVEEVTDKVRAERRDAFLMRLDDATRPLVNPDEITHMAIQLLGEHLKVDRGVYCAFEPDEETFQITSTSFRSRTPNMLGRYTLTQFGKAATKLFLANLPCVVEDVETDPSTLDVRAAYRQVGIRAHASVPLHKAGRLLAAMGFHQLTPRRWRPDEIDLLQLVANRCWESIQRARVEADLHWQWHTFDIALSNTLDFIYTFDLQGRFTYANRALLSLWQKTLEEILGKTFFELDYPPELAEQLQRQIQQVIQTREPLRDHTPFTGPTGVAREYEYIFVPVLGPDGQVEMVAGSTRDITDSQRAQERLRASLIERDTLLKEIHHRVKNNLQVIVSLLSLQSDQIHDPAALAAFYDTQSRVRAIAQIHETLYSSVDLAQVEFGQYARELVRDLLAFSDAPKDRIHIQLNTRDMVLDITQAIPLGLILNELIINCLKHAFPNGRTGTIAISLRYLPDDAQPLDESRGELCVQDNGVGLPPSFDLSQAESMGMYLVRILARQLQGKVDLTQQAGTGLCVTFPLALDNPRATRCRT